MPSERRPELQNRGQTIRAGTQLWRYYCGTIEACASPESVMITLAATGFVNVRRHVGIGICAVHLVDKPVSIKGVA